MKLLTCKLGLRMCFCQFWPALLALMSVNMHSCCWPYIDEHLIGSQQSTKNYHVINRIKIYMQGKHSQMHKHRQLIVCDDSIWQHLASQHYASLKITKYYGDSVTFTIFILYRNCSLLNCMPRWWCVLKTELGKDDKLADWEAVPAHGKTQWQTVRVMLISHLVDNVNSCRPQRGPSCPCPCG